jgi:hypothetical protein
MQTMMNIGVADGQILGELCVPAEMPRGGWVLTGFPRPPAIRVATLAPHAARRPEKDEADGSHQPSPSLECAVSHEEGYQVFVANRPAGLFGASLTNLSRELGTETGRFH